MIQILRTQEAATLCRDRESPFLQQCSAVEPLSTGTIPEDCCPTFDAISMEPFRRVNPESIGRNLVARQFISDIS